MKRSKVNEPGLDGILLAPPKPIAVYVFAHGAGAGMESDFMEVMATNLAERNIASFRYNFPYMTSGKKYPDRPHVIKPIIGDAIRFAASHYSGIPLLAGGKSMGGRLTADAVAEEIASVDGLVFFGYPLHAPGKDSRERARLLRDVSVPMLFLQGARDRLARIDLITEVVAELPLAKIHVIESGNHSLKVPKKTGKSNSQIWSELADTVVSWLDTDVVGS